MSRSIVIETENDLKIVQNVAKLFFESNGKTEITFKKYTETLSDKQRNIYWLWLGVIGDTLGNTKNDRHRYYREEFLLDILLHNDNKKYDYLRESVFNLSIIMQKAPELYSHYWDKMIESITTVGISLKNMREYLTEIDNHAISLGIRLPKSDDQYYEAMGIKR